MYRPEPVSYTHLEPSIFAGNLGESIGQVFRNIGKRFTFGGEAPKDQRIYKLLFGDGFSSDADGCDGFSSALTL